VMPVNRAYKNLGPRLSIVDEKGNLLSRIGGEEGAGIETGRFLSPHGLAMDSHGAIYVGEVAYTNWPTSRSQANRCRAPCGRCKNSSESLDAVLARQRKASRDLTLPHLAEATGPGVCPEYRHVRSSRPYTAESP